MKQTLKGNDASRPATATSSFNRRQFIKITALAGAALGLGTGAVNNLLTQKTFTRTKETRLLMGSIANLTIVSDDSHHARATIARAFERMSELETILSRFHSDSELSLLNAAGYLDNPHEALRDVLSRALYYGQLTNGAFDITVEPLLSLYRRAASSGEFPTAKMIAQAQDIIDYQQIEISSHKITLQYPGAALTLDGIAKGYVIDQGALELAYFGCEDVLVEVGGDLCTHGYAEGEPWRIGIQSPDQPNQSLAAVAKLTNDSLATSGDYIQSFSRDRKLHHILDPKSGESPPALSSVSVATRDACDADALSTAVMVLGPQAGLALINRLPHVEVFMITKDRQTLHSNGFPVA